MLRQKTQNKLTLPSLVRHLALSWLMAVLVEYLLLPEALRDLSGLDGLAEMSLGRVLGLTCGLTLILTGLSWVVEIQKAERWAMVAAFGTLTLVSGLAAKGWAFSLICVGILAIFVIFARRGWESCPEPRSEPQKAGRTCIWVTVGLSALVFLVVSLWTVCRVLNFSTPTFDFGIFSQMFYYMKESGLPLTTVERDGLLSHFAVHVSPIYYLMLPFYCLCPRPATLQVLQGAVVVSAVIPLRLIGKHRGLPGPQRTLLCAVLLLYPALAGGTSYDIHENCFLTPLILWLFYGIERKNIPLTALMGALTLLVKEDAAVYVAVIGLFLVVKSLVRKDGIWSFVAGAALLTGALGYFFWVTGYLATDGDGVMTWRYANFIYDQSGSLLTVVKSVLLSPMKTLYECADTEKLGFLALTLGPLLGLPLMTRRYERYLLLIPYVLVNLMPDYTYQHNIYFQYTFGSTAFLLYLTAVNLADVKMDRRRLLALGAAALCALACFCATIVPKAAYYTGQTISNYRQNQQIRAALDTIPEDASVTATTFYTTYLSRREILYDVRYSSYAHLLETDYVVLSLHATDDCKKYATGGEANGAENLIALLEQNGYRPYCTLENVLVIYRK